LSLEHDKLKLIGHGFSNMAFNETVFVTGFPGFIATRLVRRLAAEGAQFILLSLPAFLPLARAEAAEIARERVSMSGDSGSSKATSPNPISAFLR
jgi:hypothetical protein